MQLLSIAEMASARDWQRLASGWIASLPPFCREFELLEAAANSGASCLLRCRATASVVDLRRAALPPPTSLEAVQRVPFECMDALLLWGEVWVSVSKRTDHRRVAYAVTVHVVQPYILEPSAKSDSSLAELAVVCDLLAQAVRCVRACHDPIPTLNYALALANAEIVLTGTRAGDAGAIRAGALRAAFSLAPVAGTYSRHQSWRRRTVISRVCCLQRVASGAQLLPISRPSSDGCTAAGGSEPSFVRLGSLLENLPTGSIDPWQRW